MKPLSQSLLGLGLRLLLLELRLFLGTDCFNGDTYYIRTTLNIFCRFRIADL